MRAVSKSAVPIRFRPLHEVDPVETRADRPEPAELNRLVRGLLMQVSEIPTPPPPAESAMQGVVLDLVVDGFRCVVTRLAGEPAGGLLLSPRETEIARMVAKGYPNKVIASVLEISSWTVSTHLRRMFAKLGVSSRAAMVARLMEMR